MKIVYLALALTLSGCGTYHEVGPKGDKGDPGTPTTPTLTPFEKEVTQLLQDENDYRLGLGQSILSSGLSCSVQLITSGQFLSNSSPNFVSGQQIVLSGSPFTYLYKSDFNQPDSAGSVPNSLLPTAIQPLFLSQNYKITCSGQLIVVESGWYNFELNSDDGSILNVSGSNIIYNDGNHGMTLKTGLKYLHKGVTPFSLTYAQTGGGNFGLIMRMNGLLINPIQYAH